jgi:LPS-assembly lipoprotein
VPHHSNLHRLRLMILFGALCLLTACGFHLRGVGGAALPETWKSMHLVTNDPNSEFTRAVITQFAANDVQWTDAESAKFNVVLSPERFEQRNLSLNSEARVSEFELTMSSQFKVLDALQQEVMAPTTVSVVKQMENNSRNEVGKEGEVRLLQSEMRSELAEQIMRRIGYFAISLQLQAEPQSEPESESESESESEPESEPDLNSQ